MTKTKHVDELDDTIHVLATGTCNKLSGSSRLTYQIGCMPDGEIHLRVHSNTGGGFFSQEWISLQDILTALKKRPEGKPITSILLNPLFRCKSVNTPVFILAVLLHEKLVRSMQGKLRRHELMDSSAFRAKLDKLLAPGGQEKGKASGKPIRKAPIKKAASPSKRKNTPDIRSRSLTTARPPHQHHIAGSLFATYTGSASCFLQTPHL
jgi:hypothetical protein